MRRDHHDLDNVGSYNIKTAVACAEAKGTIDIQLHFLNSDKKFYRHPITLLAVAGATLDKLLLCMGDLRDMKFNWNSVKFYHWFLP